MSPHTYDTWLGYVDCRSWRGVSVRATRRTSQETAGKSRCFVIARPMPVWKGRSVISSILGFQHEAEQQMMLGYLVFAHLLMHRLR